MKYIICLLSLWMCPWMLNAQLNFGLETGINAGAPFPSKMVQGAKGNPGLSMVLGVSSSYKFNRRLTLQAMLLYDRKKAKYVSPVYYNYIVVGGDSIDGFAGIVNGSFNNQYLTLPLSLHYNMNSKLSAGAGIYAAYLLKGSNKGLVTNGKAGYNGVFKIDDQNFDESKNISTLEMGTNVCVRYQVLKHISLQWLATYGISSVTEPTDNFKDKTHNIYTYLTLGYGF